MEYRYGHWIAAEPRPEGAFGFVYCITHTPTGRKYIGKKQLRSCRSTLKEGNTRRTKTYKESDWKTYRSSCKELKAAIKKEGEQAFLFTILKWTTSRAMSSYLEVKLIWEHDALSRKTLPNGEREYWNGNAQAIKFLEPLK